MSDINIKPISRRSRAYNKVTRLLNPITHGYEYHQPFMLDLWESSELIVEHYPNLHKVAFTINYTDRESRRLRTSDNPAAEAFAVTKRALGRACIYMLLVIEESGDRSTCKANLHAHGYILTGRDFSAEQIANILRTAASSGGKIEVLRGVNCVDKYKNANRITIGWCHYCCKDLQKPFKIADRNAPRLAASQALRRAARIFNENAMIEYRESQKLEMQAVQSGSAENSLIIAKEAANGDHYSYIKKTA